MCMSKSLNRLRKQEYLTQFDKLCDNISDTVVYPPMPARENPLMTIDVIRETRIRMMLASYCKYGPVSANYLQNNLMLPLQDTMTRVKKYERTHNIEFLLDAVNYLMLAYWQYTNETLVFGDSEVQSYTAALCIATECHNKLSAQVMYLLSQFADTEDLCWLGVIAVFLCNEMRYPRFADAFYLYTQDTDCITAGTYVNELEKLSTAQFSESWC